MLLCVGCAATGLCGCREAGRQGCRAGQWAAGLWGYTVEGCTSVELEHRPCLLLCAHQFEEQSQNSGEEKGMQRKKNHGMAVMRGWGMMEKEWVTALWSSLV